MSKIAWIFPGQGSQTVGMGKAVYAAFPEAKAVFDEADDALGEKLSTLCFEGPEADLKLTANTQPAILVTSLAIHAVFSKRAADAPSYLAGHSLGEYSALVAAGSMRLADAVRAVRARGKFMQEAVPAGIGAMAAILGCDVDTVIRCCEQGAQGQVVAPANFNETTQTVIAGHTEAVDRVAVLALEAGARKVVKLPLSAPFHCELMRPVVAQLDAVLSGIQFGPLQIPVISNVEAQPNSNPKVVKDLLLEQVIDPVRWMDCVKTMERLGVTRTIELGPGKVLSSLVKRISKQIEFLNIDDLPNLEKVLALGKYDYGTEGQSSASDRGISGDRPGLRP